METGDRATQYYRLAIAAIGLIAISSIALLYVAGPPKLYFLILNSWSVPADFRSWSMPTNLRPYSPFIDLEEYLAALQCSRAGLDVFHANPCDLLGRPHVYPLWLTPGLVPLGVGDTNWLGLILAFSFVCTVAWIAKPRNSLEATIYVIAMLSPACAFAVERGNMDLLVFDVMALAAVLFCRGRLWRLLVYGCFFFLGTLKFYPIVAMGLALKEKAGRLLVLAGVTILGWLAFTYVMRQQLIEMAANYPVFDPISQTVFGATAAFKIIHLWLDVWLIRFEPGISYAMNGIYAIFVAVAFLNSIFLIRRKRIPHLPDSVPGGADMQFAVSALMLVAVFFIGINNHYRAVLLLLFLPLLTFARREAPAGPDRDYWNVTIGLLLTVLWCPDLLSISQHFLPGLGPKVALTLYVRDMIWWLFIIRIMAVLWTRIVPPAILKSAPFRMK